MQREIERRFQNGEYRPGTHLIHLKHIGPYLYQRLCAAFRVQSLTIEQFARRVRDFSADQLKQKLQRALQNARNNQCIPGNGRIDMYHVADYNSKGYEALISLLRVLARNGDGYNIGQGFRFNPSRILLRRRNDDTKDMACMDRQQCAAHHGTYHDNLCQPNRRRQGFEGVAPYSGQKHIRPRNRNAALGSMQNSITRGRYAQSPQANVYWRRPGRMNHA